jgi:hypothetical protein
MFPHRNVHKHTWTSLDEKIHSHVDHMLIDGRCHSSRLNIRSFKGADCDPDGYLVVSKVRRILAISTKASQTFDWIDLISGSYMNYRLGKSIRLRFQTGMQFC